MMEQEKRESARPRKKMQGSKVITILTIISGLVIVQECLFLMYLCIKHGYSATAAWLTAGVGVGEAIIIAGCNAYMSLCKSDHKKGGITFEAAKAKGFVESESASVDSPAI